MPSKVLLAAPADGATAAYIRRAFEAEDWEVQSWDYRYYAAAIDYQGNAPRITEQAVGEEFLRQTRQVDFALVLKGERIPPGALSAKGAGLVVLWDFDPRTQKEPGVVERAAACGYFLTIAEGLVGWLRGVGVNAYWLPEGCDPEVHTPSASHEPYAVGFVGTVEGVPGREQWLRYLADTLPTGRGPIHLWGSFPGPFISGSAPLGVLYHGRAEPGDQGLSEVVSNTLINLGKDRNPEIQRSYGARLYRTLACGGFLLTNATNGIHEDFKGCLDTYESLDECREKIAYWLDHNEKRRKVAEQGRQRVLEAHTFRHRIRRLQTILGW